MKQNVFYFIGILLLSCFLNSHAAVEHNLADSLPDMIVDKEGKALEWHQGFPYFNEMSSVESVVTDSGTTERCEHAAVGCVPLATAEIMSKWKWPLSVVDGKKRFEFSYDNLPYTGGNGNTGIPRYLHEVASVYENKGELIKGCGITTSRQEAVIEVFSTLKYNRIGRPSRNVWDSITPGSFHNLLKAELMAGRPVMVVSSKEGFDRAGAHDFVIGGYNGDYFKINYGYTPGYNGYYRLNGSDNKIIGKEPYAWIGDEEVIGPGHYSLSCNIGLCPKYRLDDNDNCLASLFGEIIKDRENVFIHRKDILESCSGLLIENSKMVLSSQKTIKLTTGFKVGKGCNIKAILQEKEVNPYEIVIDTVIFEGGEVKITCKNADTWFAAIVNVIDEKQRNTLFLDAGHIPDKEMNENTVISGAGNGTYFKILLYNNYGDVKVVKLHTDGKYDVTNSITYDDSRDLRINANAVRTSIKPDIFTQKDTVVSVYGNSQEYLILGRRFVKEGQDEDDSFDYLFDVRNNGQMEATELLMVMPASGTVPTASIKIDSTHSTIRASRVKTWRHSPLSFTAKDYIFNEGLVINGPTALDGDLRLNGQGSCKQHLEINTLSTKMISADIMKVNNVVLPYPMAADYVFDDDYQLRELSEIKSFITENKHLPNIPSAGDFAEKGMNVAEMNNLLLQKIEELTLYMIKMKNDNALLKKRLESLTKEEVNE